jgi:hypothetical protein
MPRAYLPRLVSRPRVADSFHLDETAKKRICKTLSLKGLQNSTVEWIEGAVNCHRAIASGSASTTIANRFWHCTTSKSLGALGRNSLNYLRMIAPLSITRHTMHFNR